MIEFIFKFLGSILLLLVALFVVTCTPVPTKIWYYAGGFRQKLHFPAVGSFEGSSGHFIYNAGGKETWSFADKVIKITEPVEYEIIHATSELRQLIYKSMCTYAPTSNKKYPKIRLPCKEAKSLKRILNFLNETKQKIKTGEQVFAYKAYYSSFRRIPSDLKKLFINSTLYQDKFDISSYHKIEKLTDFSKLIETDYKYDLSYEVFTTSKPLNDTAFFEIYRKEKEESKNTMNICGRGKIGQLIAYNLKTTCDNVSQKDMSKIRELNIGISGLKKFQEDHFKD